MPYMYKNISYPYSRMPTYFPYQSFGKTRTPTSTGRSIPFPKTRFPVGLGSFFSPYYYNQRGPYGSGMPIYRRLPPIRRGPFG